MLSLLADYQDYFGPLRLLRYITVRTLLAAITALLIGFIIAPRLIARFRELKFGHGYIDDRTAELGSLGGAEHLGLRELVCLRGAHGSGLARRLSQSCPQESRWYFFLGKNR